MRKIKLKKIDLSKLKIKMPKLKKNNSDGLGLKKYKLNKEKVRKRLPLAIGLILIIVALVVFPNTLSRYASSGVSGTNINVAYSLLDVVQTENGEIVESVKLPEVDPDSKDNEYVIEVRNYKNVEENGSPKTKIINVKMRYYLEITVSTNLPMTYSVTVTPDGKIPVDYGSVTPTASTTSRPCSDSAASQIREGLYCDAHHTYYYKFTFPRNTDITNSNNLSVMEYGRTMTDVVKIKYRLPETYNTSDYQDIIELLSIKVHAEQYVKDK